MGKTKPIEPGKFLKLLEAFIKGVDVRFPRKSPPVKRLPLSRFYSKKARRPKRDLGGAFHGTQLKRGEER